MPTTNTVMQVNEVRMVAGSVVRIEAPVFGSVDNVMRGINRRMQELAAQGFSKNKSESGIDPLTNELVTLFTLRTYQVQIRVKKDIAAPLHPCVRCGTNMTETRNGRLFCPICPDANNNTPAPLNYSPLPTTTGTPAMQGTSTGRFGSGPNMRENSSNVLGITPTPEHVNLEDEDEDTSAPVRLPGTVVLPTQRSAPAPRNGIGTQAQPTYTGIYTIDGRNIRISRASRGTFAGRIILSVDTNHDLEFPEWVGVGTIAHETGAINLWRRAFSPMRGITTEAMQDMVRNIRANPVQYGEGTAIRTGRCFRCNRQLTVPASVHRGLGPDCAAILGIS